MTNIKFRLASTGRMIGHGRATWQNVGQIDVYDEERSLIFTCQTEFTPSCCGAVIIHSCRIYNHEIIYDNIDEFKAHLAWRAQLLGGPFFMFTEVEKDIELAVKMGMKEIGFNHYGTTMLGKFVLRETTKLIQKGTENRAYH